MKFSKFIFVILGISIITVVFFFLNNSRRNLPHREKVESFLNSLNYSALENLSRDDFSIKLDFEYGIWTMKNIFSYDEKGKLANIESRSGMCAELSQVTYEFIKPLFEDSHRIVFLRGNEESFFSAGSEAGATHYLIKLLPKDDDGSSKALAIDPSFGIYDYVNQLEGYAFVAKMPAIDLFADGSRDLTLWADTSYPILFLKDAGYMLSLAARRVDDKYDENNFALVISAVKEGGETGEPLFALMMRGGEFFAFKNREFVQKILDGQAAERISNILLSLFEGLPLS